MDNACQSNLRHPPRAGNPEAAARGLEDWRTQSANSDRPELRTAAGLADAENSRVVLEALFGNAPFLGRCALAEPEFFAWALSATPETCWNGILSAIAYDATKDLDDDSVKRALRIARRRAALLVAIADLTGKWSIETSAHALSRFAEAAIARAVEHVIARGADTGDLDVADPLDPAKDCGLIVLGMGKLGGGELNYSSDVDLIVLYDLDKVAYRGRRTVQDYFVRLTRSLVSILDDRTVDGYVFRTDLRLRPDPGATPLALSVSAAETYYESLGQNWERAAMIKARPIAGDRDAGDAFLQSIRPFVWRRFLDFAAIQDIHAIKRQIHSHKGGGEIQLAGHNIKLGRGGIREIEFFAQTQQLIWGGRYPELRTRGTIDALNGLATSHRISPDAKSDLTAAYWFLRGAEQRLQMVEDRQTHVLPNDDGELARFATFLGYDDPQTFLATLHHHLHAVADHYGRLFEESPDLAAPTDRGGSLVFTGVEGDEETLTTLSDMGFERTETVWDIIRGWHHGRLRAMRSTRAREILTSIMPNLLAAFSRTANPSQALLNFHEFLSNLPAGVQLFSLFQAHPPLLDLVAQIMGTAPKLAIYLSRHARLFDVVLTEGFLDPMPEKPVLAEALRTALAPAVDFQDTLDMVQRWTGDAKFQVSVQQLKGLVDSEASGRTLADIADLALEAMTNAVQVEFAKNYGRVPGAGLAILGYGKLGSRALNRGSDLDIVFVYDIDSSGSGSDGPKSLMPSTYYNRLCQRLITALSAPTAEGKLYEVDIRLRPMGNDGPIASEFIGFGRYYHEDAWTWELMALTRARVAVAAPELANRLADVFHDVITRKREPAPLMRDVVEMRVRMAQEHGTSDPWSVKHVRGGLIDVEFIAQALQLRYAAENEQILSVDTALALRKLVEAGYLSADDGGDLIAALRLYLDVQAMARLCLVEAIDENAPAGLREALARVGGCESFATLHDHLRDTQSRIHGIFKALIEAPIT